MSRCRATMGALRCDLPPHSEGMHRRRFWRWARRPLPDWLALLSVKARATLAGNDAFLQRVGPEFHHLFIEAAEEVASETDRTD